MPWLITAEGSFGDNESEIQSRVGWYFPSVKHPWQREDENPKHPMLIGWEARDDDNEMMYRGIMDMAAYDNNLEDIFDWCVNDAGATSLWCKIPGEAWGEVIS